MSKSRNITNIVSDPKSENEGKMFKRMGNENEKKERKKHVIK